MPDNHAQSHAVVQSCGANQLCREQVHPPGFSEDQPTTAKRPLVPRAVRDTACAAPLPLTVLLPCPRFLLFRCSLPFCGVMTCCCCARCGKAKPRSRRHSCGGSCPLLLLLLPPRVLLS